MRDGAAAFAIAALALLPLPDMHPRIRLAQRCPDLLTPSMPSLDVILKTPRSTAGRGRMRRGG